MGYDVIAYSVKWRRTVNEFEFNDISQLVFEIEQDAASRIDASKKNAVFGLSFGGLVGMYIAKRHTSIGTLILNVTHGNFARLIWAYKPAHKIISKLKSSGVDSYKKLQEYSLLIEPATDIELLKEKDIVCFVAEKDKIVPDPFFAARKLEKINKATKIYSFKHGHFASAVIGLFSSKKWQVSLTDNLR